MPHTSFKVFVSSTYNDLIDYRTAARDVILQLKQTYQGMEFFGARSEEPVEACLKEVEQCDLFIGIYAWRYGFVPEKSDISITEMEFQHAQKQKKPILCFLVDEKFNWNPLFIEFESIAILKKFKNAIQKDLVRNQFTDVNDFKAKLSLDLANWILENRPDLKIEDKTPRALGWQILRQAFEQRQLHRIPIKRVGMGMRGPEWLDLKEVFFEMDAGQRTFDLQRLDPKKFKNRQDFQPIIKNAPILKDCLWYALQEQPARMEMLNDDKRQEFYTSIITALNTALKTRDLGQRPADFKKMIDEIAQKLEKSPAIILGVLKELFEAIVEGEPVLSVIKPPCSALLVGDAGMGKTTLMRRLTLQMFDQLATGSQPDAPIPLFIRLDKIAQYMDENQPMDEAQTALYQYICDDWKGKLSCKEDLTVQNLETCPQPIQFIFDGLDEIPSAKLRMKLIFVTRELRKNSRHHVLITSRPAAVDQLLVQEMNAPELRLLNLSEDQTKKFVKNFFKLYHAGNEPDGETDTAKFNAALESSDAAREFAANPLYLTVMILMHKKYEVLPKKRLDLYQQFYEMLLQQRTSGDNAAEKAADKPVFKIAVENGNDFILGVDDYSPLLQQIAFLTHQDDQDSVSIHPARVQQAMEARKLKIAVKNRSQKDIAEAIINFADNVLGVLVSRGEAHGFTHRSLQEYLTARHLASWELDAVFQFWQDTIIKKPDRWLEVARLLMCELRSRQGFLEKLEKRWATGIETTNDSRMLLLIGAILSDLRGFYEQSGAIQPLNQTTIQILTRKRDTSHGQPELFLASGDALGLLDEPKIKVDDPPMVYFAPEKPFRMGAEKNERERPIHEVQLSPYWLGKYPVTNQEFAEFMRRGGYEDEKYWLDNDKNTGFDGRSFLKELKIKQPRYWLDERFGKIRPLAPVVGVSWFEAMAWCRWWTLTFGEKWCRENNVSQAIKMRLPTEAEWEFAARGYDERVYPWGNTPEPNSKMLNFKFHLHLTTTVGSYPKGATPERVFDLIGNIIEWCFDWYNEEYYQDCSKQGVVKNPLGQTLSNYRVLRGGDWVEYITDFRAAYRTSNSPSVWINFTGFRCSRAYA